MISPRSFLRVVFAFTNLLFVAACVAGAPPQLEPTNTQPDVLPNQLEPGAVPTVVENALSPTPTVPPDWVNFPSESPLFSLYHPPGWTVMPDGFHVDFQSPSGYAWAEVDLLSSENPGLDGELLASGGDLTKLLSQLELALRENGSFGVAESLTRNSGGSLWVIEGKHESFGDNVVIAFVSSGSTTFQFIGHQGDPTEDWLRLKTIYRQMIESMSF